MKTIADLGVKFSDHQTDLLVIAISSFSDLDLGPLNKRPAGFAYCTIKDAIACIFLTMGTGYMDGRVNVQLKFLADFLDANLAT